MTTGIMVISIDFELMWGMVEKSDDTGVKNKVRGVKDLIPRILQLFEKYNIHATWAVVGFLIFEDKDILEKYTKNNNINYTNSKINSYNYIDLIRIEDDNCYYFGNALINQIKEVDNQKIGSHSFSHYYAKELGQTIHDFERDVEMFDRVLLKYFDVKAKTYIPPRFQHNSKYNEILKKNGYNSYRGIRNEKMKQSKLPKFLIKKIKFLDRYFNLLGKRSYYLKEVMIEEGIYNIKESYYMRPFKSNNFFFEYFKIIRIKKEMTHAAKKSKVFHLWWHPHDFGINIENNMKQLEKILIHYSFLKTKYNFSSMCMNEVVNELKK